MNCEVHDTAAAGQSEKIAREAALPISKNAATRVSPLSWI
jgi:hypothetical protein